MSYLNFTKQHIFNAFDELLSEIPFDKITVQMIIDRSGVSKSTFYRHFKDKYDVLNFNSLALGEHLIGQCVCHDWHEFLLKMFQAIAMDAKYYRRAFRTSGQNAHSGFLYNYSFSIVEKCYLHKMQRNGLTAREHFIISQYCYGCVGVLQDWLNHPDSLTPEEMAGICYDAMPEQCKDSWIVDG